MPVWWWLVLFVAAVAVLVVAGTRLAAAGDEIAERTRLSGMVVGVLLVALATSMPELLTDVSAALDGAPDLAVGDLFGSSMANMAILAVLDLVHRGQVWPRIERGQLRVAAVAIALTALAALGIASGGGPAIGWVGLDTVVVLAGYAAAVAWFRRGGESPEPSTPHEGLGGPTGWWRGAQARPGLRVAVATFAVATVAILVAAPVTAVAAREIATAAGVAQTTFGAGVLAVATSLPELVASLAAVRIGAYGLAVGNLFGSSAANMAILFFTDVAYRPGPILAAVDPAQLVAALGAILLMALAVAAVVGGTETRIARLEPDAVLLLVVYVAVLVAVGSAAVAT